MPQPPRACRHLGAVEAGRDDAAHAPVQCDPAEIAASGGLPAQQWYDSQEGDDPKFVRMFFNAIARKNPERKEAAIQNGDVMLRAVVAKTAA